MAIDGRTGVNGQSGFIGIEGRAHAENFLQIDYRGEGLLEGDTEGEVTSQGKSYNIGGSCREETGDILLQGESLQAKRRERSPRFR